MPLEDIKSLLIDRLTAVRDGIDEILITLPTVKTPDEVMECIKRAIMLTPDSREWKEWYDKWKEYCEAEKKALEELKK